ncbi:MULTISPECIES: acetylglutamate kinase [Helicobacter]|uniref:Acetylglutamate kinase n=1 Tax=Helicobacter colisuis TaxID=2949739 RepID=A0ABT0TUT8_9HELI|nr:MULTISPECIES: acetylglutamate kinase [Helicobacter]MCI2235488.1 acetylglutamate kinase [Helicobacter sp. CaF467b]MCI7047875.1 acetylglutamate kinase [Helicobacter sp.]MCI7765959.1 acetylglutamate kinase [Helicobacter sp.]MCL9819696.1 acetylglutamate kinase [Helicobacter colisuis]MCL9821569.1 acetylglutamate kinase [Helicobacter colisuis]
MHNYSKIVSILLDSLPYIKIFRGSKIVIKYGGAAQINPELKEQFAMDIVLLYMLGIKPIIVHGGGKRINELLGALKIESEFINGVRVTSAEALKVVEMVLSGEINKEITSFLNHHGVSALGMSGKDASLFLAKPKENGKYGYTGEIIATKGEVIDNLLAQNLIPVIAPIAYGGESGHPGFNINADSAASAIAIATKAKKAIFLTDTQGVLDANKNIIESLNLQETKQLINEGVISGGMIPKVEACLECITNGVEKAHIIDGRIPHSLLLELFTSAGIGSEFVR